MSRLVARIRDKRLAPAAVAALWGDWRDHKNSLVRERLIEHYLPFARMIAAKLYGKRHCEEFEFDDYLQFATIGLMECVDRFDPKSAAQFTTFAVKRINGCVLDGIERLSERQQQINTHQRLILERSKLVGEAVKENSRHGSVFERLAEIAVSLALGHILDDSSLRPDAELAQPDNQYRNIELRQLRDHLLELVEELPERERLLIKYNYFNHMAFDTVAQYWGVSRSRIAQLHRSALDRLRKSSVALRQYDVTC